MAVERGHGGGAGDRVSRGQQAGPVLGAGEHPGGHGHGVAHHQEGAAGQGGVHEVHTQAAEELLDHNDGEEVADEDRPVGQGHGADKGQQHAGDRSGQIAVGTGFFQKLAVGPLEELTAYHRHGGEDQGPGSEDIDGHGQSGDQGNEHIPHQPGGVHGGAHMGRRGHSQFDGFCIAHAFFASISALRLAARLRISNLAVRKDWTRGTRAGQI